MSHAGSQESASSAQPVVDTVVESVLPTAPSTAPEAGVIVDLPQVVPEVDASLRILVWLGAGSAAAFAALAVAVGTHWTPIGHLDGTVHLWVLTSRGPTDISIANVLTWGGATLVTIPALAVIGALAAMSPRRLRSRMGSGVLLAGVASLGAYLGLSINNAMGGERPSVADWAGAAGGPTFPSGHTTMATIFAASCVWALASRTHSRQQLVLLCCAASSYAVVVGLTRVWLGVHWTSDVLGGWLFGFSWTVLAASAVITIRRRWPRPSLPGATT